MGHHDAGVLQDGDFPRDQGRWCWRTGKRIISVTATTSVGRRDIARHDCGPTSHCRKHATASTATSHAHVQGGLRRRRLVRSLRSPSSTSDTCARSVGSFHRYGATRLRSPSNSVPVRPVRRRSVELLRSPATRCGMVFAWCFQRRRIDSFNDRSPDNCLTWSLLILPPGDSVKQQYRVLCRRMPQGGADIRRRHRSHTLALSGPGLCWGCRFASEIGPTFGCTWGIPLHLPSSSPPPCLPQLT